MSVENPLENNEEEKDDDVVAMENEVDGRRYATTEEIIAKYEGEGLETVKEKLVQELDKIHKDAIEQLEVNNAKQLKKIYDELEEKYREEIIKRNRKEAFGE